MSATVSAAIFSAMPARPRRALRRAWRAGLLGAGLLGASLPAWLPAGMASASDTAALCHGGTPSRIEPGRSGQLVIQPGTDFRLFIDAPLAEGRIDLHFDSFLASPNEQTSSSNKIGVLLVACRNADPNHPDQAELLRVIELEPGVSARNFVPIIATDRVREGDFYSLRAIAFPRREEERSRLRRVLRGAAVTGTMIWGGGGTGALVGLAAADLLSSAAGSGGDLPFGLAFTVSHEAMAAPEQPAAAEDPALAEAAPPAAGDDILLQDWAAGLAGSGTPLLAPFLPDALADVMPAAPEDTPQTDPSGHLTAPTRASVGARVPVQLHDTQPNDWLILIDADAPDDAMTGRYNRGRYAVRDGELRHRTAAGFPGRQELRLHRSGEGIIARQEIELVDIDIELLGPPEVTVGSRFDVFLNPVMNGHLIIIDADHDPEDVVGRASRMRFGVSAAEGPGVFTRRAPREPGEYEVRFHFNLRYSDARMMARWPIRVVEDEVATSADEERLDDLAAQIAALEERADELTLAQAREMRAMIEALGMPALALLLDMAESGGLGELLALALLHAPADMLAQAVPVQPAMAGAPAPATVQPAGPGAGPGSATATDSGPGTGPQAMPYQVTGVAADDMLNVRAGPGVENVILGMLAPDAAGISPTGRVETASDGGTWWQIDDPTLPGGTGWVNARFLHPQDVVPAAVTAQDVLDAPRNLTGFRDRQGEVLHFRITGARSGTIWGTDIYSDDSHLSRAAVHAGMLAEGETAVLAVEILPGQSLYDASERHGVSSRRWARPWHGSFRFVGRAEAAPATAAPAAAHASDPMADAAASTEPAAATPLFRVTGIDANAALYLRDRPSEQGAIVGILPPDAEGIEATGNRIRNRGIYWAELVAPAAPDGVGWALEDNLERMAAAPAVTATQAAAEGPEDTPDGPTLAQIASDFTGVSGYRGLDLPQLDEAIWDMLPNAPSSAMAPGAALSPLIKALLAVQAHDGTLPHARYHLRYGQIDAATQPGRPTERLSLIELRRFNLGPARHRELQQIHGADNVAPAAHFGEGPHVGWRLVTRGLRGTRASLVAASRSEIDDPSGDCFGFHCLMGQGIIDHLADWDMQGSSPAPAFSPSYRPEHRGGPSSAAALDMLALHHGMASPDNAGEASWRDFEWRESVDPGEPFIDVIIEIGLGQDAGVDVMLRDSHVMDTSVETIWHRIVALGGGQIIPGQAVEHRPGHQ